MKLSNNTVLITGGSSGIGLELTRVLSKNNNRVIICGRSEQKLNAAKAEIPGLITYQCDLSEAEQCHELANWLRKSYSELNVIINNAALVNKIDFLEDSFALDKLEIEVNTNLLAPIRLIKMLYEQITKNPHPAIINITTGLIYTPRAIYPFYNATKAALHSFTQVLRLQSKPGNCKIVEVMFPAVDTPWHDGNPPKIAIPVEQAVAEMLNGLSKGKEEIRIAGAKILYLVSRLIPGFALKKVNSLS
jgi:uncharacterized oxidoreductase